MYRQNILLSFAWENTFNTETKHSVSQTQPIEVSLTPDSESELNFIKFSFLLSSGFEFFAIFEDQWVSVNWWECNWQSWLVGWQFASGQLCNCQTVQRWDLLGIRRESLGSFLVVAMVMMTMVLLKMIMMMVMRMIKFDSLHIGREGAAYH